MQAQVAGFRFQALQDLAANPLPPPVGCDCHPADAADGLAGVIRFDDQAAGGDNLALMQGYGVDGGGVGIMFVHFDFGRDALLGDEYL